MQNNPSENVEDAIVISPGDEDPSDKIGSVVVDGKEETGLLIGVCRSVVVVVVVDVTSLVDSPVKVVLSTPVEAEVSENNVGVTSDVELSNVDMGGLPSVISVVLLLVSLVVPGTTTNVLPTDDM